MKTPSTAVVGSLDAGRWDINPDPATLASLNAIPLMSSKADADPKIFVELTEYASNGLSIVVNNEYRWRSIQAASCCLKLDYSNPPITTQKTNHSTYRTNGRTGTRHGRLFFQRPGF